MSYHGLRMKTQIINISDCRHFRGYRYGLYGNNLYEDYVAQLHANKNIQDIRAQFIKRLLGNRSLDFGNTLGINLTKKYKNWDFPWNLSNTAKDYKSFENPDIVCHTSLDGILVSHINREFRWLEDAYHSISQQGYLPDKYGYVNLLQLSGKSSNSYIVLDGNHRISSLAALGIKEFKATIIKRIKLNERLFILWPGYLFKNYTLRDAKAIFNRYFLEYNLTLQESENYTKLIYDEELDWGIS